MIRAPRSLLARILWWHGLAVVVTALAVSIGVYLFLDATADHLERQMLRAQAVAVRGTLGRDAAGRPSIAAANRTGSAAMAGMSLILLDARGVRLDRSPAALPLAVARGARRRRLGLGRGRGVRGRRLLGEGGCGQQRGGEQQRARAAARLAPVSHGPLA